MAEVFTFGSDEGLFPQVELQCLSHYQADGTDYVDLTLSTEAYEKLKEHFCRVLAEEGPNP